MMQAVTAHFSHVKLQSCLSARHPRSDLGSYSGWPDHGHLIDAHAHAHEYYVSLLVDTLTYLWQLDVQLSLTQ